jgi:predicted dinucleotide-binding enzyme
VLVPAEVLPGSDFGSAARRARTPAIVAGARSPSAADAAATATVAALEVVMPRLPSATRRSSGSKIVIEVARAVHESLRRLGMEDSAATEVSQRVSAERARWGRGGTQNRSSARVDAPLNDSAKARR